MLSKPKIEGIDDVDAAIEHCELKEYRHHFATDKTYCKPTLTDDNRLIYIQMDLSIFV
mgnify:CR=1 FL=1